MSDIKWNDAEMEATVGFSCKVKVTSEDIEDILTTAFEGGINYWADDVQVIGEYKGENEADHLVHGGELSIHLTEGAIDDSDKEWYDIDRDKFLKGLRMYLSDPEAPYNILRYGNEGGLEIEICDVDAAVADLIVQYALFDEEVFA